MKVILTQDIPTLGKRTDVVEVKPGFARNYLIPQGKALPASDANLKRLQQSIKHDDLKQNRNKGKAEELAKKLAEVSCTATVQAGEDDKLFGSVTAADIAGLLAAQGLEIDKRRIALEEPIKKLGVYNIPIKLHQDVEAIIKLWVVRQ
ncbi:MAG: 50S ribosomal protein L9 [Candidatus Edwardsbacteria bacterium]|jgi:large subunit ribosomal protein L9|nr:50S ribosomal protein L9 [Candidatus Edwardsbacteria bacterium]